MHHEILAGKIIDITLTPVSGNPGEMRPVFKTLQIITMEILSAKLVKDKKDKDQKCLTVGYKHPTKNKKIATYEVEFPDFVHADLVDGLKGLIPHFCLMIEEVNQDEIIDVTDFNDALFERFRVTSFSIAGKEDDPGITLTGYKVLSTGRAITINSPFFKFNQKEEDGYPFMPQFENALQHLKDEIQQYIDGNKYAPNPQLSLDIPEENVTNIQIDKPEAELTNEEKAALMKTRGGIADKDAMDRVRDMPNSKKSRKKKTA